MTTRTYDQYCAIARGLEVVGDRWTLLVVRELLTGPQRYGELLEGLPGIATNLLADRLRTLEAAGVIERTAGTGAARSRPYRLTPWGAELQPVLVGLARWATPLLGVPRPEDAYRLRWLLLTLEARLDAAAAAGLHRVYEFRIDDEVAHVRVADGRAHPGEGGAEAADVIVRGPRAAFLAWGTGRRSSTDALGDGIDVRQGDGTAHPAPARALDEIRAVFGTGASAMPPG